MVHCNSVPPEVEEAISYVESKIDELSKLGYEPDKYKYPDINADTEVRSLFNHFELYEKRLNKERLEPDKKQLDRIVNLILLATGSNKFEPDVGYKDLNNILSILDSSLVKDSKSPGFPYQSDGLPTNAQVLKTIGKKNFAELVLSKWDEEFVAKWFIKVEPTKKTKLDADMPRGVTGLPLHFMVKCQAMLKNALFAAVENWEESPIKYAFSPEKPGHINHLSKWLGEGAVFHSDKTNWDWNMYSWIFKVCKAVTKGWVVKPSAMSQSEFQRYMADLDSLCDMISDHRVFRCSNGRVFQVETGGIMLSGILVTILWNTLGQLAVDIFIKVLLGWSDQKILDFMVVAGGDDVLQSLS